MIWVLLTITLLSVLWGMLCTLVADRAIREYAKAAQGQRPERATKDDVR